MTTISDIRPTLTKEQLSTLKESINWSDRQINAKLSDHVLHSYALSDRSRISTFSKIFNAAVLALPVGLSLLGMPAAAQNWLALPWRHHRVCRNTL